MFIGAAVHLADKGFLANPLLRAWAPQTADRFFIQPPLHAIVLASWLQVAGVSALSVRVFQAALLGLGGFFTSLWSSRLARGGGLLAALLPFLFLTERGARNDALGFALLSLGIALAIDEDSPAKRIMACLALTLAPVAWPATIAYALPMSVALLVRTRHSLIAVAQVLVGGAFGALTWLAAIHFQVATFLADLSWHARVAGISNGDKLGSIAFEFTNGWGLLLCLPFYLLVVWIIGARLGRATRPVRVFCVFLLLGVPINIYLHPVTIHFLADPILAAIGIGLLSTVPSPRIRRLCAFAVLFACIWAKTYQILEFAIQERTPFQTYSRDRLLQMAKEGTPVVDEIAARYLFDYRLPEHALFLNFSQSAEHPWPTSTLQRRPGEIWIVGMGVADRCAGLPKSPRAHLLGHEFLSMPERPWDLQVVR